MRIGYGWDSHAFQAGVPLILGGLPFDHPQGLAGHSDGDVLLHALTDALLGAVAAGDIGTFFPPGDPRWKNADSALFLQTALEEVEHAGYKIANVDTTLILATPKIGPVAEKLRERLAELLAIDPGCVGIKAKTPEGLHQDDVAIAHAVVLLEKLEDGGTLEQMAAVAEPQKQMDDVVRKLVDRTSTEPARKPVFNTDDIT
ncbi:MAG TPA: 2-C-methyl-D-erythritol 2,4-cyclodiphosphate synthase [Acidobacteriaceae bacterium]|nr:2-C-methyl-D-erythritol 2,4-cyclodiphosphate synthase [Acidobacteriaceae bacterium]